MNRLLLIPFVVVLCSCASAPQQAGRPIAQDHFAEIQRPDIPLEMNTRVQDWLDFFQGPSRDRFQRYLQRSGKYIPMMRKILQQHGLPENLVNLAMIESGFNPHAYSRARATGAWQFVYRTGLRYGLRADSWIDERRDPEKSTVAAAKYLQDLYDRFDNWYLAAASYNAGEGKIGRAIRKYDTKDFWELAEGRYLRAETKNYVPKLIAAALISMDPAKYGFRKIEYEEPVSFDEVMIDGPVDLRVAARCAGASYEDLKGLNPELLHWITPPDYPQYWLKIPKGTSEKFHKKLTALKQDERMGDRRVEVNASMSITQLAKKNGIPPVLLAAANNLGVSDTLKAGSSVVVPYDPPEGESFREEVYEKAGKHHHHHHRGRGGGRVLASRGRHGGPVVTHTIRSGDTLSEIAKKYNVTTRQIRAVNKIGSPRRLKPGRALKIPVRETAASAGPTTSM